MYILHKNNRKLCAEYKNTQKVLKKIINNATI